MHRGYLIEDLAEHSDFMDVCYLLLYGELPNAKEKTTFEKSITYHTMLHEQMNYFFRGFRRDSHPMAVMVGMVGAMRSEEHTSELQYLMRLPYAVFCLRHNKLFKQAHTRQDRSLPHL